MEYYTLTDGTRVPVIGLGTWQMGGRQERDESNVEESVVALENGLALGMLHIDTAEVYGAGCAEEIVGRVLTGRDRSSYIITSKFWQYTSAEDVVTSVRASLSRLGIDQLDFCLAHRPPEDGAWESVAAGMRELVALGLAKYVGVSNFTLDEIKKMQQLLGDVPLSATQEEYNIFNQRVRHELLDYCREHNIMIMAHRPLAKGMLDSDNSVLKAICEKHGKGAFEVALRWVIQQDGIITIAKAMKKEHLEQNARAVEWQLDEEDMQQLFSLG